MSLQTLGIFYLVLFFVPLYVAINFGAAVWLIQRNWKRIWRLWKIKIRQITRTFASPEILFVSGALAIFLWYAIDELRISGNLWWSAFNLLCIALLPIWIGCRVLEKIFEIKDVTHSVVNRVGFYVFIGFLIWFAKAMISDEINKIFPFDPALMPLALTAGIFLVLSGFSAIPTALVTIVLEILCFIVVVERLSRKKVFPHNFLLALFPMILFVGAWTSAGAFSRIGLSDLRTLLITRIAYEYDFSDKNLCFTYEQGKREALKEGEKVLFVGASQDRGIAATAMPLPNTVVTKIRREEVKNLYPVGFRPVICNQPVQNK